MMTQPTILVADDEPHIVNAIALKLRHAGYRVLTARDGQQALQAALVDQPDLLIADYHMPLLSGLELCQRLRQANAAIPTIMLTARGYTVDLCDAPASGILRTIAKPFSPRQLLASVEEVLGEAAVAFR